MRSRHFHSSLLSILRDFFKSLYPSKKSVWKIQVLSTFTEKLKKLKGKFLIWVCNRYFGKSVKKDKDQHEILSKHQKDGSSLKFFSQFLLNICKGNARIITNYYSDFVSFHVWNHRDRFGQKKVHEGYLDC